MRKLISVIVFLFSGIIGSSAQQTISVEEYIDTYKKLAVDEMKKYKIPASITLAQGILESNSGNSALARIANNHFGIKCHKEWTGDTFYQDDDVENECFRKYLKASDSYHDHSEFLFSRERYKSLFDLSITDYKSWAHGLKKAGYATNPKYPELLIKIIEENRLYVFDSEIGLIADNCLQESFENAADLDNESGAFEICDKGGNNRIIFKNNGVRFIFAREGDDLFLIASEFEIYTWQLYKYNDIGRNNKVLPGQKVYLEKKKTRSGYETHVVKQGESLYTISQDYGIRLKSLCRMNKKLIDEKIVTGERIRLK